MRIYFTLLAIILAGSWCAHAQSTLSGIVTNHHSQPLDGAHIHIGQLHGASAPNGYYEVHGIAAGRQRIIVSYIGYKSLDTLVDISQNTTLNASLTPEARQLEEIVLTANTAMAKNTIHQQRLKAETIEKYSSQSLGDALKEIAGVSSLKTGSTIVKPVINGLHSSRVPVISNNVRLEDQQWGTEHAPNLDINSAGRVSVIKGAAALQYGGDAIGGVVLVEPATVLKDTLYGKTLMSLSSNGRGGSITSSLHKGAEKGWAWNAGGTFKHLGDRETPDYNLSNTGNREANFSGDVKYIGGSYDVSAFYSFYNATIGIAKATHIGNVKDLVNAINSGEPNIIEPFTYNIGAPRQEVQHHLAKANLNKQIDDESSLSVQYAFQLNDRQEYDLRRGDYIDKPALDLTLATHSAQADWKKEKNGYVIKSGISASTQHNDASPDTGVRPLIPTYDKYDAGAYGMVSYSFTESFTAEAGARYDFSRMEATKFYQKSRWDNLGYDGEFDHFITQDFGTQWLTNPEFTFHNISASLGARKKLGSGYDLFANVGLTMRNPNPSELFSDGLHHSNGTIELGDLRMDKEKAVKVSATLVKSEGDFTFEASPYLNAITDFIYLSPTAIEYTIRGAFPVYSYRQTNAVLTGVDLQSTWNISEHFRHGLSFAYVNGTDTTNDKPLIDMPSATLTNSIRYTSKWHCFFTELRSEAVFGQKRYPNFNFDTDIPIDGEFVSVPVDVSTPPPGYHLLHFDSGVLFKAFRNSTMSIGFSVNNILNTTYRDYLNRQRLYADEAGRNFQLQIKFNY